MAKKKRGDEAEAEPTQKLFKFTQVSGFDHVDGPHGVRHWATFLLIDREADVTGLGFGVRQIRGLTTGGLPVFTYWINPDAKIELQPVRGGKAVMIGCDGEHMNMDQGVLLKTQGRDGELVLGLSPADIRNPSIKFEDIDVDHAPFGHEVDGKVLETYVGSGYPFVLWMHKDRVMESHATTARGGR